ncbi:MAG: hypothetical protein MUD09_06925, partial [Desulfobacterales bacterium]|nr:hypothetical protein [Desulfobacterales bacterium]
MAPVTFAQSCCVSCVCYQIFMVFVKMIFRVEFLATNSHGLHSKILHYLQNAVKVVSIPTRPDV